MGSRTIEIEDDGYLNMLLSLDGGNVVRELDAALTRGVNAVLDYNGASQIQLNIEVKRIRDMESAMTISNTIKQKHPEKARPSKAMFISIHGGLIDQPQEQTALDLHPSGTTKADLHESATNVSQLHKTNPKDN